MTNLLSALSFCFDGHDGKEKHFNKCVTVKN